MADLHEIHKIVPKKMWFVLFNVGTIIYFIVSGMKWDAVSIFSSAIALILINVIAWLSARRYKDWK